LGEWYAVITVYILCGIFFALLVAGLGS